MHVLGAVKNRLCTRIWRGVHFRRLSRKRPLQPFVKAEYSISKKMGGIRCFAVEMARRGRSGGTTNLRCLVRPRRLETRTQRGFPHFHSNGGYCSLAHLKRQNPPKSRGPPDSRAEPKNQRVYCHLSGLLAIGNLKIPGLAIARHASFITAHPIVREFTWRTGAELAIGSY